MHTKYENITEEILELAGVKINGSNPWDIRIHNDEFYSTTFQSPVKTESIHYRRKAL